MTIYSIYTITNLVNGKVYVGKTINPHTRFKSHITSASNGSPTALHSAMRKYGFDNFRYEIVDQSASSDSELNALERKYITKLNSCLLLPSSNGYNMTMGGDGQSIGFTHTSETKQKMSKTRKGMVKSKEHCEALSNSKKGTKNPMYGVTGENNPNFGKVASDETKAKQRLAATGSKKNHVTRTCPHCGCVGRGGTMTRYHFDNCRKR